jgi:hypothetical protein
MYESYINLKPNELHQRLLNRKLHPKEVRRIKDEVAELKEARRVERITRTHRKAEWANVLDPLRYELNNAKVGRRYALQDEARVEAFDAYIAVMEKVFGQARVSIEGVKSNAHADSQGTQRHRQGVTDQQRW